LLLRSSDAQRWRRVAARLPFLLQQRHYTVLAAGTASNFLTAPSLSLLRAADAASGHVATGAALPALLHGLRTRLVGIYELSHDDLVAVISLKHSLMQWRPNLRLFTDAQATSGADVRRITSDALEVLHGSAKEARDWPRDRRLRAALRRLCEIRGVGPATGALVCALAAPGTACFVVDEVLSAWALHGGGSGLVQCRVEEGADFQETVCAVARACRAKARGLNGAERAAALALSGAERAAALALPPWTCLDVQMALWAAWQLGARGEGAE
jgi:hypothetical protein